MFRLKEAALLQFIMIFVKGQTHRKISHPTLKDKRLFLLRGCTRLYKIYLQLLFPNLSESAWASRSWCGTSSGQLRQLKSLLAKFLPNRQRTPEQQHGSQEKNPKLVPTNKMNKREHKGKAGCHSNNILAQDGRRSRFKYTRRQLDAGEAREGN